MSYFDALIFRSRRSSAASRQGVPATQSTSVNFGGASKSSTAMASNQDNDNPNNSGQSDDTPLASGKLRFYF